MTTKSETAPKTGPYRNDAGWHAAHAAAVGAHRGDATARATMTVLTHLAWRAPGASVAWHKSTNPAMVAQATTLGISVGMPLHEAVALAVASLPAHDTTVALAKETAALAPAKKK